MGDDRTSVDINSIKLEAGTGAVYGPYLRLNGFDPVDHEFSVSCLVVVNKGTQAPVLTYQDESGAHTPEAAHLDSILNFDFYRYNIAVKCGEVERPISYTLQAPPGAHFKAARLKEAPAAPGGQQQFKFMCPGKSQTWRYGFYSCNGFSFESDKEKYRGLQPMWADVLKQHAAEPMHVMIGGGDQLYCDPVWDLPSLKKWLDILDDKVHFDHEFNPVMEKEVTECYMRLYIETWSEAGFTDAMAAIPQVMSWDDHDIFDGWGSYPRNLQTTRIFLGIFAIAKRFYGLWQQHSTADRIHKDNEVFGKEGWNWVGCMGPSAALVVVDARMERTNTQVVSQESWDMIKDRISRLPPTVRHVLVVLGVPILYKVGVLDYAHCLIGSCGCMQRRLSTSESRPGMSGIMDMIITNSTGAALNQFGQAEVLDDLVDHWSNAEHGAEKLQLIHMLQNLGKEKSIRFTFISGDVHLAAIGRASSVPAAEPKKDHRLMYQIVSSAIGNAPPPKMAARAFQATIMPYNLDPSTIEEMLPVHPLRGVFRTAFNSPKLLEPKRNWCFVKARPTVAGDAAQDGSLEFYLHVEKHSISEHLTHIDVYEPVVVPPLESKA